jgi:hypothetical protein
MKFGSVNGVLSSFRGRRLNEMTSMCEQTVQSGNKSTFATRSYGASHPLVSRTIVGGDEEKEW